MSNYRIALIAEGKTDKLVIEAAIESILGHKRFSVTQLQPDEGAYEIGRGTIDSAHRSDGWNGVYRWCRDTHKMGSGSIEGTGLEDFDLVIVHIDADVAGSTYQAANIADNPTNDLPCVQPCPPAEDTVDVLESVLKTWLPALMTTRNVIPCIPSQCTESWVAVALYAHTDHEITAGIECRTDLADYLSTRSGKRLIRKHGGLPKKEFARYRAAQGMISVGWGTVQQYCPSACKFSKSVQQVLTA